MKRWGALFAVLVCVGGVRADTKADLQALQGAWSIVRMAVDGQDAPIEMVKQIEFTVKGDAYRLTQDVPDAKSGQVVRHEIEAGKIKLDAGKNPKTLDYKIEAGPDKGKTQHGIYSLEKDRFTFAIYEPGRDGRPAKLEGAKDVAFNVLARSKAPRPVPPSAAPAPPVSKPAPVSDSATPATPASAAPTGTGDGDAEPSPAPSAADGEKKGTGGGDDDPPAPSGGTGDQ